MVRKGEHCYYCGEYHHYSERECINRAWRSYWKSAKKQHISFEQAKREFNAQFGEQWKCPVCGEDFHDEISVDFHVEEKHSKAALKAALEKEKREDERRQRQTQGLFWFMEK